MRKYRLAAVLAAAVILSGCDRTVEIPEFSFSEPISIGSPENSEESSIEESSSDEDVSSSAAEEKNPEKEGEHRLILDPYNEITLVCEDNKIIVTAKTGESSAPQVSIPHSEKLEKNSGGFIYTAEIRKGYTGYGTITVIKNTGFRIYAENGRVNLVEIPEAEEANENAVKNAVEQPENQVAEYVAVNADKAKIAEVLGEITELSNKICGGLTDDYDKLRAISRWVSANIYYDYAAFEAGVPADTLTLDYMLKNSSSVCGGYSNMTSALAAVQGIKVYNVHGSAVNNGKTFAESEPVYHEWNFAEIDGRVIWVDSGWNSYCYRYKDGRYVSGNIGVKYFDISKTAIAQNHRAKYAEYRDYFALLED